jgi:hypothetical protein
MRAETTDRLVKRCRELAYGEPDDGGHLGDGLRIEDRHGKRGDAGFGDHAITPVLRVLANVRQDEESVVGKDRV